MTFATRKFDEMLSQLRAEQVRSIARMWGVVSKLPKDECIALIRQGLNDPEQVKAAVARLDPFEQVALAMLKQSGGVIDHEFLLLGVLMSGVHLPPKLLRDHDPKREFIRTLIHRGIIVSSSDHSPTYINNYGNESVYSDHRLLEAVKPFPPHPAYAQSDHQANNNS